MRTDVDKSKFSEGEDQHMMVPEGLLNPHARGSTGILNPITVLESFDSKSTAKG